LRLALFLLEIASDEDVEELILAGHLAEPIAIVDDPGFRAVEDFERLIGVGGGVGEDVVAGERRAGGRATGGIADGGGEIAPSLFSWSGYRRVSFRKFP